METNKAKELISSLNELIETESEKERAERESNEDSGAKRVIRSMDNAISFSLRALSSSLRLLDVIEKHPEYRNAINEDMYCVDLRDAITESLCLLSELSSQKRQRIALAIENTRELFDERGLHVYVDEWIQ